MTVLKISKFQGFVRKTIQACLDGKICLSHTNASNFGGRCNRYFSDIGPKLLRLPNFDMLFQLVLTKFSKRELFSCLPKVDHVIKSCKEPIVFAREREITCHPIFLTSLQFLCQKRMLTP